MTADEYAGWREISDGLVAGLRVGIQVKSPCVDCLPDFAAEMRGEGLCDGTPRSRRLQAGETWTERRREQWRAYKARQRARGAA